MRKIICDRCEREIPKGEKIGYVAINWRAPSDGSLMIDNPYEELDFCHACMADIAKVIDFKILAAPQEDELDPEEEEAVERIQKVPAKKAVDPVKFRELLKEGKSMSEIADYFQIAKSSAYNYKKAFEREYNKGFTGGGVCGGAGNALHVPKEVEA